MVKNKFEIELERGNHMSQTQTSTSTIEKKMNINQAKPTPVTVTAPYVSSAGVYATTPNTFKIPVAGAYVVSIKGAPIPSGAPQGPYEFDVGALAPGSSNWISMKTTYNKGNPYAQGSIIKFPSADYSYNISGGAPVYSQSTPLTITFTPVATSFTVTAPYNSTAGVYSSPQFSLPKSLAKSYSIMIQGAPPFGNVQPYHFDIEAKPSSGSAFSMSQKYNSNQPYYSGSKLTFPTDQTYTFSITGGGPVYTSSTPMTITFTPTVIRGVSDQIQVLSDINHICKQKNRSSMDFSVPYPGNWDIKAPTTVSFDIMYDKAGATDQDYYQCVKNGNTVYLSSGDYNYYIANPSSSVNEAFIVEFTPGQAQAYNFKNEKD